MKLANKIIELTENKVAKDVVNFINKEMKKKFLKDEWTDWNLRRFLMSLKRL
jgi:hypothetical protein